MPYLCRGRGTEARRLQQNSMLFESNPHFSPIIPQLFNASFLLFCASGAAFTLVGVKIKGLTRHRRAYTPNPKKPQPARLAVVAAPRPDMKHPSSQLDVVARVAFETVPLLNGEEARLLPVLEQAVRDFGQGHRLMAQTSLGEILRPLDGSATPDLCRDALAAINSKRLDFAIFNRFGILCPAILCAAIEYQGSGHFTAPHTFLRNAVKREAPRKAGVPYIEVDRHFDPAALRTRIAATLKPPTNA